MCVNEHTFYYITFKKVIYIIVFTSKQVAQALNVSEETVRRWIRNGELEAETLGKSYRISEENIRRLLRDRGVSYDLTMFPKLSDMVETAMRAGLNPAKIAITTGKRLSEEDDKVDLTQSKRTVAVKIEEGNEELFDTHGMEDEIETLITKMESELEILRKAKKILQEKKGINRSH